MEILKKQLNSLIPKHIHGCLLWSMMICFCLTITTYSSVGQTFLGCNYKAGAFNMTLEGHTTGVGFSSRLVLSDTSGIIKYVTPINSTFFQGVAAGDYLAYGITYSNTAYVPDLTVGKSIKLVSGCNKTVVVPTKVCNCNNSDGNLSGRPYSPPFGYTVNYALTDGKGTILLIKTDPNFPSNPEGVYNIVPVIYLNNTYPQNFVIGRNITTVTGGSILISLSEGFVICLPASPTLSISKSAPLTAFVGEVFAYGLTIKNTGILNTTGTVSVSDTLAQGLNFQSIGTSSLGWSCQSNLIVVNNSVRTLVNCQTNKVIVPNETQSVQFNVFAQRTGVFTNKAFLELTNPSFKTPSNTVETLIKDQLCKTTICVPYTVVKTKKL